MTEYTNDVDVMLMASDYDTHDDTIIHSNGHMSTNTLNTNSTDTNDNDEHDDDLVHKDDDNVNNELTTNNKDNDDSILDRDINTNAEEVEEDSLMLTTIDNPHSPKTAYDQWKSWDEDNGHYTEAYIARLVSMDSEYDADDDDEFMLNILTSRAINDILLNDDLELYQLV